jgi:CRISPR associated protein Cas1
MQAAIDQFRQLEQRRANQALERQEASETYWRGLAKPKPQILVLDNGATIRAKGGGIEIFDHGSASWFDAAPNHHKPKAIVFAGWGGSLTIQAARFCVEHKIAILAVGWLGELMTFVSSPPKQDAALVRKQCAAHPAQIARELVLQKLRHYPACGRLTETQMREALHDVNKTRTVQSIMSQEAKWGALSWVPEDACQLWAATPIQNARQRPWRDRAAQCNTPDQGSGKRRVHRNRVPAHRIDRGDFVRISGGARIMPGLIKILLQETALPQSDIEQAATFNIHLIQKAGAKAARPQDRASQMSDTRQS